MYKYILIIGYVRNNEHLLRQMEYTAHPMSFLKLDHFSVPKPFYATHYKKMYWYKNIHED